MIFGIGTDLVKQERITASLDRFGDRFLQRILTPREYCLFLSLGEKQIPSGPPSASGGSPQDYRSSLSGNVASAAKRRTRFVAQRFAAKEAFSKALGTGINDGVAWRDIGVHNETTGKPSIHLSEKLNQRIGGMGIEGMHVTLTDEAGMTLAVVILEKKS